MVCDESRTADGLGAIVIEPPDCSVTSPDDILAAPLNPDDTFCTQFLHIGVTGPMRPDFENARKRRT